MAETYEWRGGFAGAEIEALHAEGFDHEPARKFDWEAQLDQHSLAGFVLDTTGGWSAL